MPGNGIVKTITEYEMKHVHKLAWIGLFVNIIICFVARNLLL
ncbi:TPA: hypothetical protein ACJ2TI_005196, partial [Klebsiella pneumoniae]